MAEAKKKSVAKKPAGEKKPRASRKPKVAPGSAGIAATEAGQPALLEFITCQEIESSKYPRGSGTLYP